MEIREKQAQKYLEEAELTLDAAKAIFDTAVAKNRNLYAQVIKTAYDAMEQAVSSTIAKKNKIIPKDHPAKIIKLVNLYDLKEEKEVKILFHWLKERGKSQYVDIKGNDVSTPHETFDKEDAENILNDTQDVIEFIKELLK
ncbi:HEPN domain-containing protein [Candidatus Woesearchaeota archaeon]|nr:HEPN domain-containing protein [Candidatus Woesearchaeota archaeon]